jgi:hypothetical protein
MAADGMALPNDSVIDFRTIINAKGAYVDHPAELSQPSCFQDIDGAENIIGGAGIRILLNTRADQAGCVNQRVHCKSF